MKLNRVEQRDLVLIDTNHLILAAAVASNIGIVFKEDPGNQDALHASSAASVNDVNHYMQILYARPIGHSPGLRRPGKGHMRALQAKTLLLQAPWYQ
jgi:hypothetical protein